MKRPGSFTRELRSLVTNWEIGKKLKKIVNVKTLFSLVHLVIDYLEKPNQG